MRYRGEAVDAPYIATIWLRSASRVDIPSLAFDANEPIAFIFEDRVMGASADPAQDITWELSGSRLTIPPQLVRPKSELEVSLVVDGRTKTYEMENPLIDIKVVETEVLLPTGSRALTALIVSASTMVVVVVTLLVIALSTNAL